MEPNRLMDTYISLRGRGMSRVAALNHLYGQLCKLPSVDAKNFVDQVQALEAERSGVLSAVAETRKLASDEKSRTEEPRTKVGMTCGVCGWVNSPEEAICAHCNTRLPRTQPPDMGTATLYQTPHDRTLQFSEDMWLMLRIPNQHVKFELDPIQTGRELIVGRSDANTPVDVDLCDHAGALLGVSRAHLGLRVDLELERLIARDMGSRNGLYLNGRRIPTHETTYVQHGDQLELGRLILLAFFVYR